MLDEEESVADELQDALADLIEAYLSEGTSHYPQYAQATAAAYAALTNSPDASAELLDVAAQNQDAVQEQFEGIESWDSGFIERGAMIHILSRTPRYTSDGTEFVFTFEDLRDRARAHMPS